MDKEMQAYIYSLATTAIGIVTTVVLAMNGQFNNPSFFISNLTKGEVAATAISLLHIISGFSLSYSDTYVGNYFSDNHLLTAFGSTGLAWLCYSFSGGMAIPTPMHLIDESFNGPFERMAHFISSDPHDYISGLILMTGKSMDWATAFIPFGFALGHFTQIFTDYYNKPKQNDEPTIVSSPTSPPLSSNTFETKANLENTILETNLASTKPHGINIGGLTINNCMGCTIIVHSSSNKEKPLDSSPSEQPEKDSSHAQDISAMVEELVIDAHFN